MVGVQRTVITTVKKSPHTIRKKTGISAKTGISTNSANPKSEFFGNVLGPDHNTVKKPNGTVQFIGIQDVVMEYLTVRGSVSILEVADKTGSGAQAADYLKGEFGKMDVFATSKVVGINALGAHENERHDCILLLGKEQPQEVVEMLKNMLNDGGILVADHYNGNKMERSVYKKDGVVTRLTGNIYSLK